MKKLEDMALCVERTSPAPWGPYGGPGTEEITPYVGTMSHTEPIFKALGPLNSWKGNRDFVVAARQYFPELLSLAVELTQSACFRVKQGSKKECLQRPHLLLADYCGRCLAVHRLQ